MSSVMENIKKMSIDEIESMIDLLKKELDLRNNKNEVCDYISVSKSKNFIESIDNTLYLDNVSKKDSKNCFKIRCRIDLDNVYDFLNDMTSLGYNLSNKKIVKHDIDYLDKAFNKSQNTDYINNVIKLGLSYKPYLNKDMISGNFSIWCNKKEHIDKFKNKFGKRMLCINKTKHIYSVSYNIQNENLNYIPKTKLEYEIKYPICILSKSRYYKDRCLTHILLEKNKINHYMFVEKDEYELYKHFLNKNGSKYCILINTNKNNSQDGINSSSVRTFILNWARNNKHDYVWMLDDNIKKFLYYGYYDEFKKNSISKVEFNSKNIFSIAETLCDIKKIGIISHNFAPLRRTDMCNIIFENKKCYSSMLINTTTEIDFIDKHQEDNFFSLTNICKGYKTLVLNNIQFEKNTSGSIKGGNREIVYKDDIDGHGRLERSVYYKKRLKEYIEQGIIKTKFNNLSPDEQVNKVLIKSPLKHEECHMKVLYEHITM